MAQTLVLSIADMSTTLVSKTAVGATSLTLTSATDADGVAIPTGTYGFTIDRKNSSKEHFVATLTGTAITSIQTVTRGTGLGTSGLLRTHRKGAEIIMTDHVVLKRMLRLLNGTTNFDASTPLGYDGTATISTQNQFATKAYADALAIAGAPNATTSVQGLVELATQAEADARTATGGTGASLAATPALNRTVLTHDYVVSAVGTDAYAISPTPAVTAYVTGDIYTFGADVANTGACTLNIAGLGAKTIKKQKDQDLVTGDIEAGQIVTVVYDGTNMQMQSQTATFPTVAQVQNSSTIYAADAGASDTYAIALTPTLTAYATGQMFSFKANTANTGAATLNIDSLGAKTIKKKNDQDLETGDIEAGQIVTVIYDGTNMQMVSQVANSPSYANTVVSKAGTDATGAGDTVWAHGLGRVPKRVRVSYFTGAANYGSSGNGTYNGTTQSTGSSVAISGGAGQAYSSTSLFIKSYLDAGAANGQDGTVSFDATNVTITYTKVGSGTGTIVLVLEAE